MRARIGLFAVLLASAPVPADAQKAVIVLRHAEKQTDSNDPATPLSRAGADRARRLAEIFRNAGITAIYSTDTVRTRSTVEPLATMRDLEIRPYSEPGPLARRLRQSSPDDVALVVGHSNTIRPLLVELGCRDPGPIEEYGDLFVVVPRPGGVPALLRLKF